MRTGWFGKGRLRGSEEENLCFLGFFLFFFCVCVCSRYCICNGFNCRFCSLLVMKQVKVGEPEELMLSWFVLGGLVLISREQALPNTVVLGCVFLGVGLFFLNK